eukprot:CAMPEP_0171112418 /NCGR_PEP_ID=MMETSP0766_2-20121228/79128_1 /TAXON_ID=439317 /ORGANISM="Gambierdiscus australes, Strain CAWD 149" /LENGTH=92 /DNA_ID=CAMNT_0011574529 /DNA_START=39 /DNA_END=313 /DNA_ORIENTATION=-
MGFAQPHALRLQALERCDASPKRRETKMCQMVEQDWLECAAKSLCPVQHGAFAKCWGSYLNSGGYQDPDTREVFASCESFVSAMRRCVLESG